MHDGECAAAIDLVENAVTEAATAAAEKGNTPKRSVISLNQPGRLISIGTAKGGISSIARDDSVDESEGTAIVNAPLTPPISW